MNLRNKIMTILLAVSTVTAGAIACADEDLAYKFGISESTNTEIAGGVIRLDPVEGVYLHTNSSHHSIGIKQVYIDSSDGSLVIEKYPDASNAVVTTAVTPDETLAARGITVGLSGGGTISKVFFYKNGTKLLLHGPNGYDAVASATSNIWFMTVSHK